eukprot:219676-Rhodomonas_salina.1
MQIQHLLLPMVSSQVCAAPNVFSTDPHHPTCLHYWFCYYHEFCREQYAGRGRRADAGGLAQCTYLASVMQAGTDAGRNTAIRRLKLQHMQRSLEGKQRVRPRSSRMAAGSPRLSGRISRAKQLVQGAGWG